MKCRELSPIFFHKHIVVRRKYESGRNEIQMNVLPLLVLFSQWISILLFLLSISLDILHQEVLSGELIMIWEMVDNSETQPQTIIEKKS